MSKSETPIKRIVVTNDKGGASKSTSAFHLFLSYFLSKNINAILLEFDDENKDSSVFTETKMKTEQIEIGDAADINNIVRAVFKEKINQIFDIGGNRTTTLFLNAIKATRMYKKVDLYAIPVSGGGQDVKNAEKIYKIIKDFDSSAKIIFVLSRVRNPVRIKNQYSKFFENKILNKEDYIVLKDSDVIDLSRDMKKSAYELAHDKDVKKALEKSLDEALDKCDDDLVDTYSMMLEVYDESEDFLKDTLIPAFEKIDIHLNNNKK